MTEFTSREVAGLLERAAKRADLEQRQRATGGATKSRPVITMSREYGAQGAAIAVLVADKLGFQCWDQDLVHEISKHTATPEIVLESLDEHRRPMAIELLAALFAKSKVTSSEYQRELARVVNTIADKGSAVIVGRGAQFILPSSIALHVRIVAPLEARIEGLSRRRVLGTDVARAEVIKMDAERAAFMRNTYDKKVEMAHHYDLVLNSATFSLEQCRDFIIEAYGIRFAADDGRASQHPSN